MTRPSSPELQGAHPSRLRRHQVRSPEPDRQWLPRPVHNGACGEAYLVAALATFKNARPCMKTPRITDPVTGRALEPGGPPDTLQVTGTGRPIGKEM